MCPFTWGLFLRLKNLGIKVTPELHRKPRYIVKYDGSSANGQILYSICQCMRELKEKTDLLKTMMKLNKQYIKEKPA